MRILLLFFLLSPAIGNAQSPQLSWGSAAEVGIDSRKLANAINLYRQAVQKDVVRGAVLLIARDAKVIALEALGWKNVRLKLPMQKDTLFRMASNTKPVIGAAIAYLFDRGKLQFHDPVGKVLESFQHPKSSDITIHQLLTHTSGFRIQPIFLPPPANPTPMNRQQPNLQIEVNRFAKVGATAKPGTSYSYSNAGFNTLGAVIEVVSQRPLEDFLRATIYQPLDMRDTYHHEIAKKLDGKLNRMSVVYTKRNGQWTVRWKPGQAPQYPFVRASGGLISTAWDYAVFCQMMLNQGRYGDQQILKPSTVKQMTSPQTASLYSADQRKQRQQYYGYGWFVQTDGIYSHSGSDGTAAWIDPNQKLIVLALTQSPGNRELPTQFFKKVQASVSTAANEK